MGTLIIASTHAYLLIFTNKGGMWLKIYEIPDAATVSKGEHASGLIRHLADERPAFPAGEGFRHAGSVHCDGDQERHHQEVRTRLCSITSCRAASSRSAWTKATEVARRAAQLMAPIVFLASHGGMACRFANPMFAPNGPAGVRRRGMELEENDYLVGMMHCG